MKRESTYTDQVAQTIQGFISLWTKFDAMLPGELAKVRGRLDGFHSGHEPQADTSYEIFYRLSDNLARKGSLTMGEVGAVLCVPLSTATRVVDWLVERGYVQRLPDSQDRRVVRIALTENGRALHRDIESLIRERVEQILLCLSPEERSTLFNLINKVISVTKGP